MKESVEGRTAEANRASGSPDTAGRPQLGQPGTTLRQVAKSILTKVSWPGTHPSLREQVIVIRKSTLFHAKWYLKHYFGPDGRCAEPIAHYLTVGAAQGMRPNPIFDGDFYLETYADVRQQGINPLLHYIEAGAAEGRDPSAIFSTGYHVAQRSAGGDDGGFQRTCLAHFIQHGARERHNPHPLFDVRWYLTNNPDVADAGVNPLQHYVEYGAAEGRDPHPLFSTRWYLEQYPHELGLIANPLEHFLRIGASKGFKPHPHFDAEWYLAEYRDVRAANINPLVHYVVHGQTEGRRTGPLPSRTCSRGMRRWRPPAGCPPGANLIGPVSCINGLGTSTRGYLSALRHGRININVVPWERGFEHVDKIDVPDLPRCDPLPLNLVHLNLDLVSQTGLIKTSVLPQLTVAQRYNVAIVYWELASIAPEWFGAIAQFDEIWCASSFMARAIGAATAKPVRVVRPALHVSLRQQAKGQTNLGIPEGKCLFSYVVDACSGLGRKNPLAFVKAYVEEFHEEEGAACLLKVGYAAAGNREIAAIRSVADGRPDVVILDRILTSEEIAELFDRIDCYVSPHRAEGLGLTIIEAMANEKPVIATSYGGVSDFVTAETSFVVDHRLIEVGPGNAPYRPSYVWADPVPSSLRQCMRAVFEDRSAAGAKGRQARLLIERLFSPPRAGDAIRAEIDRVWSGGVA